MFCCFSCREGKNTWQTLARRSKIKLQIYPRRENSEQKFEFYLKRLTSLSTTIKFCIIRLRIFLSLQVTRSSMPRLSTNSLTRVTGKLYRLILCRFQHRLLNTVNVNKPLRTWSAIFNKIDKLRSKLQIFYLSVVYLATLLVAHTTQRHTVGRLLSDQLQRMPKDSAVAYFNLASRAFV